MSLTNIKLPDLVLADLYKQPLIQDSNIVTREVTAPPPAVAESAPVPESLPVPELYKFLGNNKQQIAIISDFPGEVFLPEEHLQFLTKMLNACKLNLGDVAILNNATKAIAVDRLKEQLQPRYMLLFGIEPVAIGLPISFPAFKEQEYAGCRYLFTPPLTELNQDNEETKLLKSKLWVCLKQMFGV